MIELALVKTELAAKIWPLVGNQYHAAAADVGDGAKRHCVVYCLNTQVTHEIAKHYHKHCTLYNVGEEHLVIFDNGETIDKLLELFCNRSGINPHDERRPKRNPPG